MILQSTSGQLGKEAISWILFKKAANLSFQKRIVLKIFWVPMSVTIKEQSRRPKLSVFPTHRTISPEWKRGHFRFHFCGGEKRTDVSWRKESSNSDTLYFFILYPELFQRKEGSSFFIPTDRNPSGQSECLTPFGEGN